MGILYECGSSAMRVCGIIMFCVAHATLLYLMSHLANRGTAVPRERQHSSSSSIVHARSKSNSASQLNATSRSLVTSNSSRSSLATILLKLKADGLLAKDSIPDTLRTVRRKLTDAVRIHANQMTPYGTVIKTRHVGVPGLQRWDYACPMALVWYLSNNSDAFFNLVRSACSHGRPMRIVIYVDECEPGNPLRPEKSRKLQCVYWSFVDFPQWVLHRTGSWFILGFMRSVHADKLPGGLSELMAHVLHIFSLMTETPIPEALPSRMVRKALCSLLCSQASWQTTLLISISGASWAHQALSLSLSICV